MPKNKIIVREITQNNSVLDYTVGGCEHLTLVFLVNGNKNLELTLRVQLLGKSGIADIIGLVIGKNDNRMVIHTLQHHSAPDTTSNLLVKSAVYDHADFSYDGGIIVDKPAQKTNAYQRNENLLLSKDATAESKPALEILANDVRCTHGATVGMVPKDQLWYLSTRGILKKEAEKLIVSGFFMSALDRITDDTVKEKIIQKLWQII